MTLDQASVIASVFANPARLKIFQLLLQSAPGGLIVGDIQQKVGVPGSTLSHHLDKLRSAGLVTVRRQGTFLWYLPVPELVASFTDVLLGTFTGPEPGLPEESGTQATSLEEVQIEAD